MKPTSWAARLARREVCASCADPPAPGRTCCAYHLERHRQVQKARRDPSYVVPPPRPRVAKECKTCGGKHRARTCPTTKRQRMIAKSRDRQKREDRRYAAGLCVQCEDPREPGNAYRRCRACRQYHAAAVSRAKKANDTKDAA